MTPISPLGRALLLVSIVAAFLYSNFILDWILRGFHGMGNVVSLLEAPGQPNATLLRVTDVITAVLIIGLQPWVRRALREGLLRELVVAGNVVFALGATAAAIVAAPCGPGVPCTAAHRQRDSDIHDVTSVISEGALFVAMALYWYATRRTGPEWARRFAWWDFWIGGIVLDLLFEYFHKTATDDSWATGAVQRVHLVFVSAWIVVLGILAARAASPDREKESIAL